MNIMVFDVPASSGGALSVLYDFYEEVKRHPDKTINWYFVVSTPFLSSEENIYILNFPWVKKSWFHRLYFDRFISPRLVQNYSISKVFSLQNIIIPKIKCAQILYLHQSLPFVEYKYKFRENKHLWIYQNIIAKAILKSIKKANKTIVQTQWMQKAVIELTYRTKEDIIVVPPQFEINTPKEYYSPVEKVNKTFFYPASAIDYKNHKIIIEACKRISSDTEIEYKVIFTLEKNESNFTKKLYDECILNNLPIYFEGKFDREKVFNHYLNSVLIFPSYIETFGLPLLEARLHNCRILAADTQFAREVLDGYNNVFYFKSNDAETLKQYMLNSINNNLPHQPMEHPYKAVEKNAILDVILK